MKNKLVSIICLLLICSSTAFSGDLAIKKNGWAISFNKGTKSFDYSYKGKSVLKNVRPEAKYENSAKQEKSISSSSFENVQLTESKITDAFGKGICYTFTFDGGASKEVFTQKFYLYNKLPYIVTELLVSGNENVSSNYLAPITSEEMQSLFPKSEQNRMMVVPWDNDGFIRYDVHKFGMELTSYEVTTLYNGISRNGLVMGSIEHDIWKSAVKATTRDNGSIAKIACYSGASSNITRDKLPHGKVSGKTVKSAKMFLGVFDDWRTGMSTYGDANAKVMPMRTTWKKGAPVGWNSWAVLANYLNYEAAIGASDFFRNTLWKEGFHNKQKVVIMDLDSFWDNMSEAQLKQYAQRCKDNGQVAGIYWCPFSYWGGNVENDVEGTNGKYKYKDCLLYVNGKVHKQGGLCMDPTHPATKERIAYQFKRFHDWGFEYVKLDFVTDGAVQGDSYHNKNVTTATQAYNEGFTYLKDVAGDDMFLSLSIAPLFPHQYGNSRRVSCDAWGTIGHSEYVMNALSNSWWTDKLFQYNDPDHVVLQNENESESENRARFTTGLVTGMILLGDNFCINESSKRGNPKLSMERASSMLKNKDLMEIAHLERTFIPVYGYKTFKNTHYGAESVFMLNAGKCVYVACFNYDKENGVFKDNITMADLGINPKKVKSVKELWTRQDVSLTNDALSYSVPAADARIYRIMLK